MRGSSFYLAILFCLTLVSQSVFSEEKESELGLALGLESSFAKRFTEQSHASWHLLGTGTYSISPVFQVSAQTEFFNVFGPYQQAGENLAFEDTQISLGIPELMNWAALDANGYVQAGVLLPTSRTSQLASLRYAVFADFGLSSRKSWGSWQFTTRLFVLDHQYETRNAIGVDTNSYFILRNSFSVSFVVAGNLNWEVLGRIDHLFNYRSGYRPVYRLETGPQFAFSDSFSAFANLQYQDRVVSNNSFLDDDTSKLEVGIRYNL